MSDLMTRYPAISDLAELAKRRIPHFAWEFLDSGTGADQALERSTRDFQTITLTPRFMRGSFEPAIRTELFGVEYDAPFGVAPVGMNGMLWPGTDRFLAAMAAEKRIPYAMSTAANDTLETLGRLADGMGWFQLYPPRNSNIRSDLLARAKEAGFTTLLVTVDVPVISRRERQVRAGISGAGLSARMLWQIATRPAWAWASHQAGRPHLNNLEPYLPTENMDEFFSLVSQELNGTFDWAYLDALRAEWEGPLVVKGVLDPDEAREAVAHGVDGILVSSHGGRQVDSAPASIDALPKVADAVQGQAKLLLDSGVRSGLDIARALALGADFVLCGRAFMFGCAALGEVGAEHAFQILRDDLVNSMSNLGCATLEELRERVRGG